MLDNMHLTEIILQYIEPSGLGVLMQTCNILRNYIISSNYWYFSKNNSTINRLNYNIMCKILYSMKILKIDVLPSYSRAYCHYIFDICKRKSKLPLYDIIYDTFDWSTNNNVSIDDIMN